VTLRAEIANCDVLIGLLTEESLKSGYVTMEFGAAWGLQRMTCAVLAPNVDFKSLPGPLVEHHAIRWDRRSDLAELVDVIAKATGFPIAKIAAKLAVGYLLDEIRNDITRETPASFEPTIDYVVVKVPRFAFEKFPQADPTLNTQMKSVGEAMAIGRTFKESLQKCLRSLEIGRSGLGGDGKPQSCGQLLVPLMQLPARQSDPTRNTRRVSGEGRRPPVLIRRSRTLAGPGFWLT